MHELIHVAVLVFTLCGAAAVVLLALWPLVAERPPTRSTRTLLGGLIALGAASLLVEWTLVH